MTTAYIDYSASRWDIYCDKPGADKVAQQLNDAFNRFASEAFSAAAKCGPDVLPNAVAQAHRDMTSFMESVSGYGASDTEPRGVMESAFIKVFGESTFEAAMRVDSFMIYQIEGHGGDFSRTGRKARP